MNIIGTYDFKAISKIALQGIRGLDCVPDCKLIWKGQSILDDLKAVGRDQWSWSEPWNCRDADWSYKDGTELKRAIAMNKVIDQVEATLGG